MQRDLWSRNSETQRRVQERHWPAESQQWVPQDHDYDDDRDDDDDDDDDDGECGDNKIDDDDLEGECGGARPPDTQQCSGSCREPSRTPGQPNGWTRLENGLDDHDDVDEDEAYDEENYDSALDHTVLKQVDAVDDVDHMRVSPNPK